MNFVIHRDVLRERLAMVSGSVSAKSPLPILSNVLIQCTEHEVLFTATNLEVASIARCKNNTRETGALTLPAKLLIDLTNNLPSEVMYFKSNDTQMNIQCGGFTAEISGISADDYPDIPNITTSTLSVTVDAESFAQAIHHVVLAAAADNSRPVLTAVRLVFGETMTLTAADGFRLALRTVPLESAISPVTEVLVPAKTMAQIARLFTAGKVSITMGDGNQLIRFECNDDVIVSRIIEGKYPDVQRVIPTSFTIRSIVDIADIRKSVRIATLLNDVITITMRKDVWEISANGKEKGNNRATISCLTFDTSEYYAISVNARYLLDALNGFSTKIMVDTQSPQAPLVIRPAGDESTHVHIVMPISTR